VFKCTPRGNQVTKKIHTEIFRVSIHIPGTSKEARHMNKRRLF